MTENWKLVVGHDGYEVSDLGRVRSLDRIISYNSTNRYTGEPLFGLVRRCLGRILIPTVNVERGGHLHVHLGRDKTASVHRLVLEAFIGPCPAGMECLHGNGDESQNALWNLKWGTHDANMKESSAHGTISCGENHVYAKLTESDVVRIRSSTEPSPQIAAEFGINSGTVRKIRRRERWRHVA